MDALHLCPRGSALRGRPPRPGDCSSRLLDFLEQHWDGPDEGIWEVRGPRRHFTHSKVMAWVAFDRAVKAVEAFGLDGPVDRWRDLRDEIHAEVCAKGFDADARHLHPVLRLAASSTPAC